MRQLRIVGCLVGLLIGSIASPSRGDYVVNATVTPPGGYPTAAPTPRVNLPVTIEKFDPALGTLKSVEIQISGLFEGVMGVENTSLSSPAANVNLRANANIALRPTGTPLPPFPPAPPGAGIVVEPLPPSGPTVGGSLTQTSVIPMLTVWDGLHNYGGTSGQTIQLGPGGAGLAYSFTNTYTSAADMAGFIGASGNPGNLDYLFSATGSTNGNGTGGNMTFFYNGAVSANIAVRYTVVPEPSSLLLLALGLALPTGFRFFRR